MAKRVGLKIPKERLDLSIRTLNNLGYSLATIGERVGCHAVTVSTRLSALGEKPADTRRNFMEDILNQLKPSQIEWLSQQLGETQNISDYVRKLIIEDHQRKTQNV